MDKAIRWAARTSPIKHLSNYLLSRYRKNVTPEWRWVDGSIGGKTFRLKVNTEEVHGYLFYMCGVLEPELTYLIKRLLPSRHFFLDIGANVGYYTVLAAMINPECRIHSFEPSPSTFGVLSENVAANHLLNVQVHQLALGDKTGTLKFNIYADQAFNSPGAGTNDKHHFFKNGPLRVIDVPSVRLDEFLAEHHLPQPDIVKLDVEGFELFVLKGANKLLASDNPPVLLCEVAPLWLKRFGLAPSDLFQYVEKFGYQTLGLTPYGLVRKELFERYSPIEDIVFVQKSGLAEIMKINSDYYSGWRKAKGEIKKILRPLWRRFKKCRTKENQREEE
jgi:FkbM family methyltransferase